MPNWLFQADVIHGEYLGRLNWVNRSHFVLYQRILLHVEAELAKHQIRILEKAPEQVPFRQCSGNSFQ